jgi:hypothetical protein
MSHERALTPAQRAVFEAFLPDVESEGKRGKELKALKEATWSDRVNRVGTKSGGEIIITGYQPFTPYHRNQWEVTLTTLQSYVEKIDPFRLRTNLRLQRAMEYPLGWLFSSTSILALVWAEIHWCAISNITAALCKGCDGVFTPRKHKKFCSPQCWEDFQNLEGSNRRTLKGMHQQLTRRASKAEQVTHTLTPTWIRGYTKEWMDYEEAQRGSRRPAKSVHPVMVALQTLEGKRFIERIRQSKQIHDALAIEYDREALDEWLRSLGVLIPPDAGAWIDELCKRQ